MRGYVLAAGFGTRLQPITDVLPKALVSVCGVPLVEVALRYLRKNGFEELAVNTHYQAELMEMFLNQLPYKVTIFDEQPEILGTGGAIYNAREFLGGHSSFCVINADIVTNAPLKSLAEKFDASSADVVLLASSDSGDPVIGIGAHNRFVGRVDGLYGEMERAASFIGITFYKKEMLDHFTANDADVRVVWRRLVEAGYNVEVWDLPGLYWQDTGTPEQLSQLYWDILDKKMKFDFPLGMEVDFERKVAWANSMPPSIIADDASYVWVEQVLGDTVQGTRAIIHGGVALEAGRTYTDCIVTPWCEVTCASSK